MKLLERASLLILAIRSVYAAPILEDSSAAQYYRPESTHFIIDLSTATDRLILATFESQEDIALEFIMAKLNIANAADLTTSSRFADKNGVAHFHFTPVIEGYPVVNAEANVNVDQFGRVSSVGYSWTTSELAQRHGLDAKTTSIQALAAFASKVGLALDVAALRADGIVITGAAFAAGEITAEVKYYRTESSVERVFELIVPTDDHYYNAFVSITSGQDWTIHDHWDDDKTSESFDDVQDRSIVQPVISNDANVTTFKYRVIDFPKDDNSKGRSLLVNPADLAVSPLGWHNNGKGNQATTMGNNVQVQNTKNFVSRRPVSLDYNFDFVIDDATQTPDKYWEGSATNLFYVVNFVHDVAYHYGFDEVSGNFQSTNFGKGGAEGDFVIANGQDRGGTNNANFATPPDGRSGTMKMYLFNQGPATGRDGSLDNVVVSHEMMHGVSNRLTGGPKNANCLSGSQSGGMGEGWSDMLALVITTLSNHTRDFDRPIGRYVLPKILGGIRQAPYSTNLLHNNLLYSAIKKNSEVHAVGTVWCTILFEVYWNLVDKLGFIENVKDNANSGMGNTVFLANMIDALKLQPCNPTFIQARDAFIEADRLKNSGANKCDIWIAFAKRGLGFAAKADLKDDFTVPTGC